MSTILYYLSWPLGPTAARDHCTCRITTPPSHFIHHLSAAAGPGRSRSREADRLASPGHRWRSKSRSRTTDSNPYGVDNSQWPKIKELFAKPLPPGSRDDDFINDVTHRQGVERPRDRAARHARTGASATDHEQPHECAPVGDHWSIGTGTEHVL